MARYELARLSMVNPLVLRNDITIDELPRVSSEVGLHEPTNAVSVGLFSSTAAVAASIVKHWSCVIRLG